MMATRSDRHVPRRRISDDRGVHINFIIDAQLQETGEIFIETRGSKAKTTFNSLGVTRAAEQLSRCLVGKLYVKGGTWTSVETFRASYNVVRVFLNWIGKKHGIFDLTDTSLTPTDVWTAVLAVSDNGSAQRHLRTILADALVEVREDGDSYRDYLYGRSLRVDQHRVAGYAPEVADEIERLARRRVGAWFVRHRDAVREALSDLPNDWLHIDARLLIGKEPVHICPQQFAVGEADLAAAMVLLALIDNVGPNLATIQSYTCDSVELAGKDESFVTGVKARNRQIIKTPAPAGGLYSYGGLLEFVTAATRVDRLLRDHSADFDRLLFVATGADRVMSRVKVCAWWNKNVHQWDLAGVSFPTLSFQRLRKAALLRGGHRGNGIIGQSRQTARLYLADAVPDVILIPGLLDTQSSVTDHWRKKTRAIGVDTANGESIGVPGENVAIEPLIEANEVMDVGVAACASNGYSPNNDDKPCGLGPVACFVCPNGYRIPEIIPGLLAMVQFTDDIRRYEPAEWVAGEAPVLNSLAQKALDQFPSHLVSAVPPGEVANSRVLIECIYLEGRSND